VVAAAAAAAAACNSNELSTRQNWIEEYVALRLSGGIS